jgi:hypothetical protein
VQDCVACVKNLYTITYLCCAGAIASAGRHGCCLEWQVGQTVLSMAAYLMYARSALGQWQVSACCVHVAVCTVC